MELTSLVRTIRMNWPDAPLCVINGPWPFVIVANTLAMRPGSNSGWIKTRMMRVAPAALTADGDPITWEYFDTKLYDLHGDPQEIEGLFDLLTEVLGPPINEKRHRATRAVKE
jgi:hypothetical protein